MLGVDVVDERFIDNHSSLVGMQRTLLFLCARTVRDLCRGIAQTIWIGSQQVAL